MPVLIPSQVTTWRGKRFTRRTAAMLAWVEKHAGVGTLQISQGGWNVGGVTASGSTHDKDGVDLRTKHLSKPAKRRLLRAMKDAGFAAWIRAETPGVWGEHLHAVPIPPSMNAATVAKYLSPGAAAQVVAYDGRRDGLRGNRFDDTYRPNPRVRFSALRGRPVPRV